MNLFFEEQKEEKSKLFAEEKKEDKNPLWNDSQEIQEKKDKKKEPFQVIITDVRGRSKTTSLEKTGHSGILKNSINEL